METRGKKIAIVIPAYEAEQTLESVFLRIPAEVWASLAQCIVVNDGSSDRTREIVEKWMDLKPQLQVIDHGQNRGYAQAQKSGYRCALAQGADIVALLHADGQYAPELLPTLLEPLITEEADVVQGSRMMGKNALQGGMPLYKYIANRVLTWVENICFGMNMAEYHSGYMLYARRTLESIPFERLSDTFHFDGEMLLMAHKHGLRIKQIPIPTHYGTEKSHLRPVKYGVDVLRIILRNALGKYDF